MIANMLKSGGMAIRIILISTLLAFLLVGYTQAATITVCPNGCDYTSIQAAVYAAHPNDTIEIQSGTYNESVVLTKNIMFKGIDTGSGEPIVNGDLISEWFHYGPAWFQLPVRFLRYPGCRKYDYSEHNNLLDRKSICKPVNAQSYCSS